MSWQSTFVFVKGRLVSKSFLALFVTATGLYIFDASVEAYAQSTRSPVLQAAVFQIFGPGMLTIIYLAAILEALGLSMMIGYGASRLKKSRSQS